MKVTWPSMGKRASGLDPLALGSAAVAVLAACSLTTDLDGFTDGTRAGDAGSTPATLADASTADVITDTDAAADHDAATSGAADAYGDAVRADSPQAWWRFEDAVGAKTLHDEMGSHDGTALAKQNNPITIRFGADGVVGKGAEFGPNAGYFAFGDVFDFAGQSELSLEAWLKNDHPVNDYEGVFNKRRDKANGPDSGWLLFYDKDAANFSFQFWDAAVIANSVTTAAVATGFHHLVVVAQNTSHGIKLRSYLDGQLGDGDPATTHDEPDTMVQLVIGFDWSGSMDELAIYDHALTSDRVLAHYAAARP